MKPINFKVVKIKNLLGLIDDATYLDLLYEIVYLLSIENRMDGEFKLRDVSLKTRVRLSSNISDDLDELIKLGYVEKLKSSSYKIINHPWEANN